MATEMLVWPLQFAWRDTSAVSSNPTVERALANNAVVAVGVSGGKDSAATAFAVTDYLNARGHDGPRVLIHADLGRVEWKQSLPACERLADRLDLELRCRNPSAVRNRKKPRGETGSGREADSEPPSV